MIIHSKFIESGATVMQPHGYLYAARGGATIARHPRPAEEGRRRRHRASDVDRNARADRATHRRPRRDTVVTHCCGRRRHLRTILYVRYAIRPPCTLRAARPLAALARRRAPAIVIIYTGRAFVRVGSHLSSPRRSARAGLSSSERTSNGQIYNKYYCAATI